MSEITKRGGWKLPPRTPEQRAALSAALKAKWASGKRRRNPAITYEKSSATKLRMFADGTHGKMSAEDRTRIGKLGSDKVRSDSALCERMASNLRAIAKAKIGGHNPPGRAEIGERNHKSKWWHIRSPAGLHISGLNMSELVRKNAHLFDPDDVVWKKSSCRASRGLKMMFTDGKCCSWKGWTAMNCWERRDYLARNVETA